MPIDGRPATTAKTSNTAAREILRDRSTGAADAAGAEAFPTASSSGSIEVFAPAQARPLGRWKVYQM
jgi:hypothetical protein